MNLNIHRSVTASAIALMAAMAAPSSFAQATAPQAAGDAEAQQAAAGGANGEVGEIIVTASRRAESIQNVPIAVSAFSAQELQSARITDTNSLQRIAPSLVVANSSTESNGAGIRVRGVGTSGTNFGLEGAVGVFIDGVYVQRPGLALNNLFDIRQIEILRGPQGTLFGKNTSAGALVISPATPDLNKQAFAGSLTYGSYNNVQLEGMANLPLSDTLGVRVAGTYQNRDGYIKDLNSGKKINSRDRWLGRAQLLWEPAANIKVRLVYDHGEKDEACCATFYVFHGPTTTLVNTLGGSSFPTGFTPFDYVTRLNQVPIERTIDNGVAGHINIDLGGVTISNIIAKRKFKYTISQDLDFSPVDIWRNNEKARLSIFSEELTLAGKLGIVDWLVGGYYSRESLSRNQAYTYGAQLNQYVDGLNPAVGAAARNLYPFGGGYVSSLHVQKSRSFSFFTHNVVHLTDALSFTGGVRYNNEHKDGGGRNFVTNSPSCTAPGVPNNFALFCARPDNFSKIRESAVTGIGSINYKVNRNILVYASYSHGYKAGGINLDRDATIGPYVSSRGVVTGTQQQVDNAALFRPETVDSYEIGIKSELFDRKLTVNAAAFRMDYKDFQVNSFNGVGFTIVNAGSVKNTGFEIESKWSPIQAFSTSLGVTYLDAKYGSDAGLVAAGLANKPLTLASKWSIAGSVHVEQPVGFGTGFLNLNATYRSKYNANYALNPLSAQKGFVLLGGSIGVRTEGWEVAAFGNNITDKRYQNVGFNSILQAGGVSATLGAPREFGLRVSTSF